MNKVLFMGRKNISANLLKYFFSQKNIEIVGVLTDSHLQGSPVAKLANNLGLKLYLFEEALELIESGKLCFDLGVSVLYWRKFKGAFLSSPSKGIINFHPAPLPGYRGTGGYNLAILESRDTWEVTAHYVDKDIDTGGIIDSTIFRIDPDTETVVSLEKKSMEEMEHLAKRVVINAVNSDSYLPTIENKGGRYISRSEMESMKAIMPGDDIDRKIRAFWFPPYDGAYIEINQKKYTLVNRELLNQLAPSDATSLFAEEV